MMVPHRYSVPLGPISTILPPCFASTRIAWAGVPPYADTVNLPSGHQLSISFRNTVNAFSWLQGTSMVLTIGASITLSFSVSCVAQSQHHKKTRHLTRNPPGISVDHPVHRAGLSRGDDCPAVAH